MYENAGAFHFNFARSDFFCLDIAEVCPLY